MKKILNFCTKYKKWIISFCLVFAIAYPWIFRSGYLIRVGVNCLMYASISLSLNLIIGNLGQMSMGHAAFWGIGAYTSAILSTKLGMGSIGTLLVTIVVVAVFSFLLGMPVLKLKGYYMTVVTLGFCEIIRLVELNWTSLTRGALGISRIPSFTFFGHKVTNKIAIFYMALGMLVVTVLILQALINSKHGLAILAIRDDEIAAQSIGINMFYHKMIAFVIAGVIAGVNGAFYARFSSYIDSNLFN
ncbi:MAG: branched-chain amino acid ABC transporter permease, partial [Sphaerochaetaceae bacterium]|nr:branched-chain amino acid ABC transporter permease [Sphaerochaetaceae bacterium]